MMAGENANLASHIKKCQEIEESGRHNKVTLLSSVFVNKVLLIIRKYLVRSVVEEIERNGGRFGIMMDGSQDVSSQERMSVAVRYVNDENEVIERTVLFFNAKSTTGKELYESLRARLGEIHLTISKAVGCSFDGASNMKSLDVGVISFIRQNDNVDCIYTWCLSHRYNLVVKSAVKKSPMISQVLSLAEESAKIFRSSYIRMGVWIDVAKTAPNFHPSRRLKLIGTTRWSSQQEAIKSIIGDETSFYVLIKALLRLCSLDNLDGAPLIQISSILNSWLLYENVVTTFVLHAIFSAVTPTTKFLQTAGLNILDGVESLRQCNQKLVDLTKSLEGYIEKADEFIRKTNVLLSSDKEIQRLDCDACIRFPAEDEKRKKTDRIVGEFREFIEALQNEINHRVLQQFDEPGSLYQEISMFDPIFAEKMFARDDHLIRLENLCRINEIRDENITVNELKVFTSEFIDHFNRPKYVSVLKAHNDENDGKFPLLIENESDLEETNADLTSAEIHLLHKEKCRCIECLLKFICKDEERKRSYENILKLLKFIAILPSTQVKCERDFSKMKLTKTPLRSSLGDESLENLMIISTNSKMFEAIELDDIIDDIISTSDKLSLFVGL